MNRKQILRLARLAKNFDRAMKTLPLERQKHYAAEHRAVVDCRKFAELPEGRY
jgi:hypothetical protein